MNLHEPVQSPYTNRREFGLFRFVGGMNTISSWRCIPLDSAKTKCHLGIAIVLLGDPAGQQLVAKLQVCLELLFNNW